MALRSLFNRSLVTLFVASLLCVIVTTSALADYQPDPSALRSETPKDHHWNPYDIFPDNGAWETELATLKDEIPTLLEYKGRLHESGDVLLKVNKTVSDFSNRVGRLYMYAQTLYDVDQGNSTHRQMQGQVASLFPAFGEAVSWIEPELLAIDPEIIKGFMANNEELKIYNYYFSELWRQQQHTLSDKEERLMALSGNVRSLPGDAHESLLGVDITFPEIVDAEGNLVPLTLSGFSAMRSSDTYNVRKQAADAFFGTLRHYENSFASLLDGAVKGHIFNKTARGYDSCLEAALSPDNISTDAYRMLVNTVQKNLPRTMHKYVSLRRKVLGMDGNLTFSSLYNPLLKDVEPNYTYAEARKIIAKGLKPLGKEYVTLLKKGMDPANGWIDVYPNEDKRSGAYSNGGLAKELHPYVLHNFDNSLDAVSTTAHEFGHAMHSVYSRKNQPEVYGDYTTFLAEIASTCNEALLVNYLLEEADDVDVKLMLLNQRLESIRLTIFRQTMFADFELRFHEYAEAGNPLTADYLNGLYKGLITDYYGPEFSLGINDECEWMFIPHFYYNFYVFTYATGLTSGLALEHEITKNGDKAARKYIDNMLKAGSSAPPLDILRNAGVDLETPAPIISAMDLFEETVNEFDKLWTKKYGEK